MKIKLVLLIFLLLFGCEEGFKTANGKATYTFKYQVVAYEDGVKAFKNDIPPNANPYVHDTYYARAWLDGYIDAKNETK